MIKVPPTLNQIRLAQGKAYDLGRINNSIKQGEGNIYGFLGEIVVADHYSCEIENTKDYDIIAPSGATVDIKTKACTSPPKPQYLCSIAATSVHQTADTYFFCRILSDLSMAYMLGYISRESFFKEATFHKKNAPDPSRPDFTFTTDCYNLPISELTLPPE